MTDQTYEPPGDAPRVNEENEETDVDYGFGQSLSEPDQYSKGANQDELPPAGPARARAAIFGSRTRHARARHCAHRRWRARRAGPSRGSRRAPVSRSSRERRRSATRSRRARRRSSASTCRTGRGASCAARARSPSRRWRGTPTRPAEPLSRRNPRVPVANTRSSRTRGRPRTSSVCWPSAGPGTSLPGRASDTTGSGKSNGPPSSSPTSPRSASSGSRQASPSARSRSHIPPAALIRSTHSSAGAVAMTSAIRSWTSSRLASRASSGRTALVLDPVAPVERFAQPLPMAVVEGDDLHVLAVGRLEDRARDAHVALRADPAGLEIAAEREQSQRARERRGRVEQGAVDDERPPPSARACQSAARIDWAAYIPVMKSISGTGTRCGGPSRSPVSSIRPIVACRLGSIALPPRSAPCPVIEHHTSRSGMSAGPKPRRALPTLSITTSARLHEPAQIRVLDDHAPLAAVQRVEVRALATRRERRERPALVTARLLDLDDVRAQVGKRQPAERPGDQRRELDDPGSVEKRRLRQRRSASRRARGASPPRPRGSSAARSSRASRAAGW